MANATMGEAAVIVAREEGGVATLTLNRPRVHNAFDEAMIAELTAALEALAADGAVRAVVLAATGKSFSAGADLGWMRRAADFTEAENLADARALARLMSTLDGLSKPTLALVHGAAYGGGVGLVACCDVVVATRAARFQLSEVKLGLVPAVISPYVIAAIGARQARRYVLTAATMSADEAARLGLVHVLCEDQDELVATRDRLLDALGLGGPEAIADAKDLIATLAGRAIDGRVIEETAKRIAHRRTHAEAREGIAAFLEKRPPRWVD